MSTMAYKVVFLLALFSLSTISSIRASNSGFSVNLIHRDSPNSPFHNPHHTHSNRMRNAIDRSIVRSNHFKSNAVSAQCKVIPDSGEYLMSVSLGTPPVELLAIADTGSDLLWTQCKPCEACYKQHAPLFDPKNSSTYKDVACESKPCEDMRSTICLGTVCEYILHYGDRSFSFGHLATETLTLASTSNSTPIAIPKTVFGCSHLSRGTFHENGTGIVGLGGGPLSLITQLGSQINGKFSYCLVPFSTSSPSTLNFGENGIVSGDGVVSTPLVPKEPSTYYWLTLEGISVGAKKLSYNASSKTNALGDTDKGNIIIDSGTVLTFLPPELYEEFEASVKKVIDHEPTDSEPRLKLCYKIESDDFRVPLVTVHFSGADLVLKPMNAFVKLDEDVVCLAFMPNAEIAIFGNIAQMNFLVGYDVEAKTVSFKPTDCTKQ